MDTWFKATGWIQIDDGIRIITDYDVCRYYQWLVKREFWNTVKTQLPKHGAHITICSPKIYNITDYSSVFHLKNKRVEFCYNPTQLYQSKINFWIPVKAEIEKYIKNKLNVKDKPNYFGLHLTICNRKNIM